MTEFICIMFCFPSRVAQISGSNLMVVFMVLGAIASVGILKLARYFGISGPGASDDFF